jgi:hypothetical protein
MSRLGRRRSLSFAAAVAAVLIAPAAASAATYTVKTGDGACAAPGDLACGGLAEAAAAVNAGGGGDTITVAPGAYPGATFSVGNLTITGELGVLVTSTVEFSGGAVSRLAKVAVVQIGAADGIRVTGGSAGLELSDAAVVSQNGNGVLVAAGGANTIVRSVITSGTGPSAIRVTSASGTSPKSLTVESTIAGGGTSAIGAVTTAGVTGAGNINLTLRHVTAAGSGSANGILLDASSGAGLLGGGDIAATMTDSIALNNSTKRNPGVLGVVAMNTATLTATRSLTAGDAATIFASPAGLNFRLRPDATTAIGQGSVTPGESPTDIDGEDRSAAPTDLGGDEFNNATPIAKIAVATKTPRAMQGVTFDGSGSSDREAGYGGGIVAYQWTFSDGKTQTTATPTVTHVFPREGNASAMLTVVDRQGAASAPGAVALRLIDGTPPTVGIVKPKANQRIKQFTTKTRTVNGQKRTTRSRTKIVFGGLSRDTNGVAQVALTLEKLGSKSRTQCNWYNPKKGVVRKSCKKPSLFLARLKKDSSTGEWTYTVKRKLAKGRYRIQAVGIDKTGAAGNAGGSKLGVVRFRLI